MRILSIFSTAMSDSSGASPVEFALVAPMLVAVIFGLLGYGDFLWELYTLQFQADAAARCASVSPTTCGTADQLSAFAAQSAAPLQGASFSLTPASNQVCVNATLPYTMPSLVPFSVTMKATSCRAV